MKLGELRDKVRTLGDKPGHDFHGNQWKPGESPDDRIGVKSYPVGEAARHYAQVVKPALRSVVKDLGFKVGGYDGHGNPSTQLIPTDKDSKLHSIMLYWHGNSVQAGIRSKEWKQQMSTPMGQIAHHMSMGVHEAYGHSDPKSKSFKEAVTSAIQGAIREFETSRAKK